MISPIIVLARRQSAGLSTEYLGEDAAAAEQAYAAASADPEVIELALFYRPTPRNVCEPASQAQINADSLRAQRSRGQSRIEAEVKRATAQRLEDLREQVEAEEREKVVRRATAAAVGSAIDKTVREAADNLPPPASSVAGLDEAGEGGDQVPGSTTPATDGGLFDGGAATDDDSASHFGAKPRRTRRKTASEPTGDDAAG